jgi:hypothetical protein
MPSPQANLARSLAAPRDMGVLPTPHREHEDMLDQIMRMLYGPLPNPAPQGGDINLPAPSMAEQFMAALKAAPGGGKLAQPGGVSVVKR